MAGTELADRASCLLTQLSVADWSSLTRAHCSVLPSLSFPLSATSCASVFSLSEWFLPPLALFFPLPLSFLAFISLPLSHLPFHPLSLPGVLLSLCHVPLSQCRSKFLLFQTSSLSSTARRMSQKQCLAGRCFKAAVIGTCWDGCADGVGLFPSEPFISASFNLSFFLTTSPIHTYTHTDRHTPSVSFIILGLCRKTNYSQWVFHVGNALRE